MANDSEKQPVETNGEQPQRVPAERPFPVAHACIVHHRGEQMLDECLRTLLGSEGVELQVVVLSNHCQEPLPARVQEEDRVHVVRSPVSIGFSEANNMAAAWARKHLGPADYYYFLNNDTESRPDTLANLIAGLDVEERAAVAGPLTLIQAAPDHLNSLGINVTDDAWAWDEGIGVSLETYGPLPDRREVAAVTGSAIVVEASAFEEIDGWTEAYDWYFEDIDLCLKVWKKGGRVIHVPEAVIYHRVSATMTTGAERKFFFFWRNRLLLAFVHWPWGLLGRVLKWALVDEILRRPRSENQLQRRALWGAVRKLPKVLRLRYRYRGSNSWKRFLHPRGSVPVITLPATTTADDSVPGAIDGARMASAETEAAKAAEAAKHRVDGELWSPILRAWAGADPKAEPETRDGTSPRRVLVLGWAPLPFESARMNYAPGTRSWQMALPLAQAGHEVCLVCARIPDAAFEDDPSYEHHEGVHILRLSRESFEHGENLEALVADLRPTLLVGAAPIPSLRAVRLAADRPVWVDLFGDPMAEAQARARHLGEGDHLGAYWRMMAELLDGGDAFGAVSHRQRLAVIGQLSLAGRLDGEAAGRELVHVIPCALPPGAEEASLQGSSDRRERTESSPVVSSNPEGEPSSNEFRLLWSGGFNTWCDAETLIRGLELAMDRHANLVFDATGGAIGGHDVGTFAQVEEAVESSPHRQRLRLQGPLPTAEADALRAKADLGILAEADLYERQLGSSARLVSWLGAGLPFVCTAQSELGAEAIEEGIAFAYETGNPESLADAISAAVADPEGLRRRRDLARRYAERSLTFEATAAPLLDWVSSLAEPIPAEMDVDPGVDPGIDPAVDSRVDSGIEPGAGSVPRDRGPSWLQDSAELRDAKLEMARLDEELTQTQADYHAVRSELGSVHQSRMWKMWMAYLDWRGALGKLIRPGRR